MSADERVRLASWLSDAHTFRRIHSRVLSALVRRLGASEVDLAEDALQDALVAAVEKWRYSSPPDDPGAWLFRVAWRKVLDRLSRDDTHARAHDALVHQAEEKRPREWNTSSAYVSDDELAMLFLCAHPSLSMEMQVVLMLRTLCGLSVAQIAHALLVPDVTVSQRIVRAKRQLAKSVDAFEVDDIEGMASRTVAVQHALYLMFTEGYGATDGDAVVRRELCAEAIRLAEALASTEAGGTTDTFALCALLRFQHSRWAAREADGIAISLEDQDRSLWDRRAIALGFRWLERAMHGDTVSRYHLQAGIASVHAAAIDGQPTDWETIDRYYQQLRHLGDSNILRMNHAVAMSHTQGVTPALTLLATLDDSPLASSHLLYAIRSRLLEQAGDRHHAAIAAQLAVKFARTLPESRLLATRLAALSPEQAEITLTADTRM